MRLMNRPAPDAPDHSPTPRPVDHCGMVELISGCMFSGKTTALLSILKSQPSKRVAVFKHHRDDRYSNVEVVTHDGAALGAIHVRDASDIPDRVGDDIDVVAIDEGHFYDDALPDVCETLAARGKRVIVTALDLDMWGQPFPVIERLREIAGVVRVQQAVCAKCGKPATRTHRKTPIVDLKLVGGSGDFEPRCAACWSAPDHPRISSEEMA